MIPPWLIVAAVLAPPAESISSPDDASPAAAEPHEAAQAGDTDETEAEQAPPADSDPPNPPSDETQTRLDRIEAELAALRGENERLREDNAQLQQDKEELDQRLGSVEQKQEFTQQKVDRALPLAGRVGGYVDFGFFWVDGDGSGIRSDTRHIHFPEYEGVIPDSWVFMGDPLSTQINSRGDPAETAESRAIVFDPVDSRGKSSFAVNALNLDINTGVGDYLVVEGMVDFMPRNRDVANPDGTFLGDYVNVKLAYVNYIVPTKRIELDLYGGKIDSVFGYEYRIQESPDRISVTPSLLCRYTCGRPVGLKGRAKFLPNRALIFALSVTNGSTFRENFAFSNEIDTNHFKTMAGRLSYAFPVGAGLEVGASGMFGAQDLQMEDDVYQWQYGFDLHLDVRGVDLTGEFVMGKVDGETAPGDVRCGLSPCLSFKGAYGLLGYRATNWLMPYARVDWRDALHRSGASFVYTSKLVRVTPGVRFDLGTHVAIKAEYTYNRELGPIPQFRNDVVTTSVVASI